MDYGETHKDIVGQFVQCALTDFEIPNLRKNFAHFIMNSMISHICCWLDLLLHDGGDPLHLRPGHCLACHV